jgi:hypothetical protein
MEYEELDKWELLAVFIALPFLFAYFLWDSICQKFKSKVKPYES